MDSEVRIGINLRLTRAERDWFHAIARSQNLNLSDFVRLTMAEQGARLGVPSPGSTELAA